MKKTIYLGWARLPQGLWRHYVEADNENTCAVLLDQKQPPGAIDAVVLPIGQDPSKRLPTAPPAKGLTRYRCAARHSPFNPEAKRQSMVQDAATPLEAWEKMCGQLEREAVGRPDGSRGATEAEQATQAQLAWLRENRDSIAETAEVIPLDLYEQRLAELRERDKLAEAERQRGHQRREELLDSILQTLTDRVTAAKGGV
jgi:hypothetical protein